MIMIIDKRKVSRESSLESAHVSPSCSDPGIYTTTSSRDRCNQRYLYRYKAHKSNAVQSTPSGIVMTRQKEIHDVGRLSQDSGLMWTSKPIYYKTPLDLPTIFLKTAPLSSNSSGFNPSPRRLVFESTRISASNSFRSMSALTSPTIQQANNAMQRYLVSESTCQKFSDIKHIWQHLKTWDQVHLDTQHISTHLPNIILTMKHEINPHLNITFPGYRQ